MKWDGKKMEDKKIVVNNGGVGNGLMLLTSVFVVLRALEYIDWSWWVVFSPILVPVGLVVGLIALFLALLIVLFAVYGIFVGIKWILMKMSK